MKTDYDVLLQANCLVQEMGEAAIRMSRVRLVELTAANEVRAAEFWRQVMHAAEDIWERRQTPEPAAVTARPRRSGDD